MLRGGRAARRTCCGANELRGGGAAGRKFCGTDKLRGARAARRTRCGAHVLRGARAAGRRGCGENEFRGGRAAGRTSCGANVLRGEHAAGRTCCGVQELWGERAAVRYWYNNTARYWYVNDDVSCLCCVLRSAEYGVLLLPHRLQLPNPKTRSTAPPANYDVLVTVTEVATGMTLRFRNMRLLLLSGLLVRPSLSRSSFILL